MCDAAGDSLRWQNRMQFTTLDADNDNSPDEHCAVRYKGAWWYNGCHHSNLNGLYLRGDHNVYAQGVNWLHWRGYHYSLRFTEMKIRPMGL